MLVIILFVLSCFGLLLFLWESFGGPLPLKPKGYRMTVAFPKSLALAEQSEVRISGVDIGRVVALKLGKGGRTRAELEINQKYAPIRANMHAILRQKTLLGETYVQLIPKGNGRTGPFVPDNGQLADAQVEPSVTLDGILSAFDPKTRRDFQIWQQSLAEGIERARRTDQRRLRRDRPVRAARQHARRHARLPGRRGARAGQEHRRGVQSARQPRPPAGRPDRQRRAHLPRAGRRQPGVRRRLPRAAGIREALRKALKELDRFADDASPFLDEFRPSSASSRRRSHAAKPFAPQFDSFLTSLGPLSTAAKKGLPDVGKTLDLTTDAARKFRPVLHNLDPFLQNLGEYVPELQAFFANFTAATQAHGNNTNTPGGPPAALPALDAGAQPGEPVGLRSAHRHRPLQPVLQAGRLPRAGQRRAAGVQQQQLLEPRAVGQRAAQRDDLAEPDRRDHPVQGRQRAGNAELDRGARLQPAGPVHVQRPDRQFPHVVYGGK